MLSTNESMVVAGVIIVDGESCPIYVHESTGDCAYEDPNTGTSILIAEVSIDDPLECLNLRKLEENVLGMSDYMCGIIMRANGDAVVIIDDENAVIRPLTNLTEGGEVFSIDMSGDYDEENEE